MAYLGTVSHPIDKLCIWLSVSLAESLVVMRDRFSHSWCDLPLFLSPLPWTSSALTISTSLPPCSIFTPTPAIRFGRMPRSEKAKLKAEILTCEHDLKDSETADLKSLAKRIHEAYLKNFNMNKVKARVILAGKTSNNPVGTSAALGTMNVPWRYVSSGHREWRRTLPSVGNGILT